ncbi:MAG: hypothetical protein ACI4F3_06060 [Enterocloster sp.]
MVEVSAAKRVITPPFPMYMRGYAMRTGKSIGVLDELYCRALVLKLEGEIFIWATLDLCRLEEAISDYPRTVMAAKYSVPKEHIIISTIHTHSGPDISFEDEGEDRNHRKAVYRDFMMKQLFEAVDECFDRGFLEVKPYMVRGTIDGVYGNRNYKDKPSDKDINMILFRNENHVAAGIFNFTCHPTVLGIHNMKLSSDLLGNVGKALDEKYNSIFITMQGACGDMGNRQYRRGNDEKELWRVRDEIMEQVDRFGETEIPMDLKPVEIRTSQYTVRHQYDRDAIRVQIEEDQKKLDAAVTEDDRKLLWSGIRHLKRKMEAGGVDVTLRSVIFHLGDLDVVTIPGELFSAFGLQIKEKLAAPMKIIWGYANYSAGYIVEKDEFGKGYESMSTPFPQGEAELYVQHIIDDL